MFFQTICRKITQILFFKKIADLLFQKNRADPLFQKKIARSFPVSSLLGLISWSYDSCQDQDRVWCGRAMMRAGYGAGGLWCGRAVRNISGRAGGIYLGERASGRAMGRAVLCGISGRLRVRFCREAPLGVDSRCLLPISRRPYGPPGLFGPPGPFGLIRSQDIMRMHYVSSLRTHQLRCTIIELSR